MAIRLLTACLSDLVVAYRSPITFVALSNACKSETSRERKGKKHEIGLERRVYNRYSLRSLSISDSPRGSCRLSFTSRPSELLAQRPALQLLALTPWRRKLQLCRYNLQNIDPPGQNKEQPELSRRLTTLHPWAESSIRALSIVLSFAN